jgi:hypothetical protein
MKQRLLPSSRRKFTVASLFGSLLLHILISNLKIRQKTDGRRDKNLNALINA